MAQSLAVVNFAALRVAATEDFESFVTFSHAYENYHVRIKQQLRADKAADKAVNALRRLEKNSGEQIILVDINSPESKERVLDAIFEESKKVSNARK